MDPKDINKKVNAIIKFRKIEGNLFGSFMLCSTGIMIPIPSKADTVRPKNNGYVFQLNGTTSEGNPCLIEIQAPTNTTTNPKMITKSAINAVGANFLRFFMYTKGNSNKLDKKMYIYLGTSIFPSDCSYDPS